MILYSQEQFQSSGMNISETAMPPNRKWNIHPDPQQQLLASCASRPCKKQQQLAQLKSLFRLKTKIIIHLYISSLYFISFAYIMIYIYLNFHDKNTLQNLIVSNYLHHKH